MTRPCISGGGRTPKLYARTAYSYTDKLRAINSYRECGTLDRSVEEVFGEIANPLKLKRLKKLVGRWTRERSHIESMCSQGKGSMQKLRRRGQATILSAEAEEQIVLWINSSRREGIPVSTEMLHQKALEVAKEVGMPPRSFRASASWARRFFRRHKLSIRARTRQGQTTPVDAAQVAAAFTAKVRQIMVEQGISEVFNADQTAVCFEYLPRKTIDKGNARTVWIKCAGKDKERATAMLLADAAGNKRPPFVVFKTRPSTKPNERVANTKYRNGFGRQLWKSIAPLQNATGCRIFGNTKGWWDSELSIEVLKFHFSERENLDDPILLLWDDFSGHWTERVVQYAASIKVVLEKIPPRYTYVCQPADISWNRPLKDQLRRSWVSQMREQISKHHEAETIRKAAASAQAEGERTAAVARHNELARELEEAKQREAARGAMTVVGHPDGSWSGEGSVRSSSAGDARPPIQSSFSEAQNTMAYRENDASGSDTPNETPCQPQRRRRARKKNGAAFELVAPSRSDIMTWISDAWGNLTTSTITGGFKRIGLLNDTRPMSDAVCDITSDVNAVLDAIAAMSLAKRASHRSHVSSDDDIPTAGETSDSSGDSSA